MKITIKGKIWDVIRFVRHIKIRNKKFKKASSEKKDKPYINQLSEKLHPLFQDMVIDSIVERADGVKSFRIKRCDGKKPAYYRAGQYIVVESDVDGIAISRPYSISTSPGESKSSGFYEITIKSEQNGYLSKYSNHNWHTGKKIIVSEPMGHFNYEPIRDSKKLIFFAGGSGITPFRSIVPEVLSNNAEIGITLFYGFEDSNEYLFKEDFEKFENEYSKRFTLVPVPLKEDRNISQENGYINQEMIEKYVTNITESSWFICGPQPMKEALKQIAANIDLNPSRIRLESFTPDKSKADKDKLVKIKVHHNSITTIIESHTANTIVYSLERAGLNPPAYCRSGECGWCRSKLIAGEVEIPESVTGVRLADKKFNYIHPCSCYPKTDIEIEIPPNPLAKD